MKKLITLVMAVLMVACIGITAFAADTPICAFDAEDIAAFMNYNTGLAGYGVADPVVTVDEGDDGNGVRIQGETAGAWVQGFNIDDADFITALRAGVTSNNYLKLYVNNPSAYPFGLRLTFIDEEWTHVATFDATFCVLAAKDGYMRQNATADGGGMGANAAIIIPAGFDGYVYFDCANITISYPYPNANGEVVELMTDFSQISTLEIDLRWNGVVANVGFTGGADVIFDSLVGVDEVTEQLVEPTPEPTPEVTATPEPTATPEIVETTSEAATEAPSATQTEGASDEGEDNSSVIIIIVAVVVVAAVVAGILIAKNKKKA